MIVLNENVGLRYVRDDATVVASLFVKIKWAHFAWKRGDPSLFFTNLSIDVEPLCMLARLLVLKRAMPSRGASSREDEPTSVVLDYIQCAE